MKNLVRSIALSLTLLLGVSAIAQTASTTEFPEIKRYTEILSLDDNQVSQLQTIFEESEVLNEEVRAEMKSKSMEAKANRETATEEEKVASKKAINELAVASKMVYADRLTELRTILTPEQQVVFDQKLSVDRSATRPEKN